MNFLGLSGFSVFHAGHSSWQRPHSVHEVESRSIFQLPGVMSSSKSGVGRDCRAFSPVALRWKKMLKKLVKRCHITPHWKLREMKTINSMPDRSLNRAKKLTNAGDAGKSLARWMLKKSAQAEPPP